VSYDDFLKMDIRTATILEAERIPKTDKLLRLKLDTGLDQRVVVSGIAGFFSAESIVGKKVLILANLEPRTIRGIESKGMILTAEDTDGKLLWIAPDETTGNGSVVK